MTEFLFDYGLFAAKLATFVVAILIIVVISAVATRRIRKSKKGHIEISKVNDEIDAMRFALDAGVSDPEAFRLHFKQKQKQKKLERKARRKALKQEIKRGKTDITESAAKRRVYLLEFDGDLRASAVTRLRREITAVLSMVRAGDEVVLRLESRGGMVHAYGLASSQLQRIKQREIDLTVCVDKVAASGGYMMACVANKILAAPFVSTDKIN